MKLFIHIGYPNTASTTLQSFFVSQLKINCFGKDQKKTTSKDLQHAFDTILFGNEKKFEKNTKKIIRIFRSQIKSDKNIINVLTNEIFLSSFHIYKSDLSVIHKRLYFILSKIESISALKIFVIYRDQVDTLTRRNSWGLSGYIKFKNHISKKFDKNKINAREYSVYKTLKYDKIYFLLTKIYKNNEVKFFNFDDIFIKKNKKLYELSQYLEIDFDNLNNYINNFILNKTETDKQNVLLRNKINNKNNILNTIKKFFSISFQIIYFLLVYKNEGFLVLKNYLQKQQIQVKINEEEKKIIQNYYKFSNKNFYKIINEK